VSVLLIEEKNDACYSDRQKYFVIWTWKNLAGDWPKILCHGQQKSMNE